MPKTCGLRTVYVLAECMNFAFKGSILYFFITTQINYPSDELSFFKEFEKPNLITVNKVCESYGNLFTKQCNLIFTQNGKNQSRNPENLTNVLIWSKIF